MIIIIIKKFKIYLLKMFKSVAQIEKENYREMGVKSGLITFYLWSISAKQIKSYINTKSQ